MWISTIIFNLSAIRAGNPEDFANTVTLLRDKKNELRNIPNAGGESIPGFTIPESIDEIALEVTAYTVKREWGTESIGQEFVDYVNSTAASILSEPATLTAA